ncbi:hypothetical protein NH340_JMT03984 [Sarcoptes scabiei]|nr:hypothetical protein NH340_JMT03984 [Sarcoptes scabiei]
MKIAVIILFVIGLNAVNACKHGWTGFNGKCYKVIQEQLGTFSEADAHCGRYHSRSLTIQSKEENEFLVKWLKDEQNVNNAVWLGATRRNLDFAWRNDGIPFKGRGIYVNWCKGMPSRNFVKSCVQLTSAWANEPFKWENTYCTRRNQILEKKLKKLEDKLRNAHQKFKKILEEKEEQFHKLSKTVNDQQNQIEKVEDQIKCQMERLDSLDLGQISQNFTGVAMVLKNLNERMTEMENTFQQTDGESAADLSAVKKAVSDYVDKKIEQSCPKTEALVITDVKMGRKGHRRTLECERGGKWKFIGYV